MCPNHALIFKWFFFSLKDRALSFPLFPRALNEPKQASLSHQNKPKQNKPFFFSRLPRGGTAACFMEGFFFFFNYFFLKKGKKEKRRGEGGGGESNHPGEVSIRHQHGSGVIPYLMAVSEGERQRGG